MLAIDEHVGDRPLAGDLLEGVLESLTVGAQGVELNTVYGLGRIVFSGRKKEIKNGKDLIKRLRTERKI